MTQFATNLRHDGAGYLDDEEQEGDEETSKITSAQLRRFKNAIKSLNKLMVEIKETYPEANYYLQEYSMHLMIGPSHDSDRNCTALYNNSACSEYLAGSGGGGW